MKFCLEDEDVDKAAQVVLGDVVDECDLIMKQGILIRDDRSPWRRSS
jgi:hypothetical protein